MKHQSTRELYEYWQVQRGLRASPDRTDIDPGAIRGVLPDTYILTFKPDAGHPFRVAGTRICSALGRELKGESFVALWTADYRPVVRDLMNVVTEEAVGVVASASTTSTEGARLEFEWLALPLTHHGRNDARILGALSPIDPPFWLGASRVRPLNLGTFRYLAGDTEDVLSDADPATGRIRHGFVVYDGGRT
jgi:hypothetical protein